MSLVDITLEDLDRYKHTIEKAMEGNAYEWRDFTTFETVWNCLKSESLSVFMCGDADAFVITSKKGKYLIVFWSGGKKITPYVRDICAKLYEMAKACGASHVRMSGRKAWVRLLSKQGWEIGSFTLVREI